MFAEQFFISIDQVFNTITYVPGDGFGFADETLSARAWRLRSTSNAYKVIDAIFFLQESHCFNAYLSEINRTQYPKAYRKEYQ